MNDMKERLIDLNYNLKLINKIYNKFIYFIIMKYDYLLIILNNILYTIYFYMMKISSIFKMHTLSDLTIIDNIDNTFQFELIYITLSYKLNLRLFSKLYSNKEDLIISINNIYKNANWLEREIWDLFGIKFIYHPDLRRILTDYGFSGHPLLKLFPLMGFMEIRFDDLSNKIIKEAIELSQAYRLYIYFNPWLNWNN